MSSNVEQIKQRLSVVDVVGSYIKIQKAGANYKACCPFHSEKSPSFYVSPAREMWHCFGCNLGGDIFEFVKQIEGIEFLEALKILADRAGVTLSYQNPQFRNEKTALLDLMNDATFFYQKQLAENNEVLGYLRKRGLKNETLKNFNIGFSLEEKSGWRHLFNYLKNKGYSAKQMENAGMVIKKQEDSYYDRFRGRIMFPLKDMSGRIVGFSGRVFNLEARLPSGGRASVEPAKYINTPQTVLYDKSKILYGFDTAKTEIRKQDICILVEGQMDVLMSYQAGVENAVAVSGTALTLNHLEIVRRLTNNLIMAFDNDEAGLKAAKRNIDIALKNGFEVRAISLPQGKDPADVVLENAENWRILSEKNNSSHIIDFYMDILGKKYGTDSREFKLSVEKSILPYLMLIQSAIDRGHWISKIAERISAKEEIILEEMKKIHMGVSNSKTDKIFTKMPPKARRDLIKEKLAGLILWKKNKKTIPSSVQNEMEDFMKNIKKSEKEKLAFESELYYGGTEELEKEVQSLSEELKKENLKYRLEKIAGEMKILETEGDTAKLENKLSEFQKLSKELAETQ